MLQSQKTVEIYIDGASRGNPGDSGIGILIKHVPAVAVQLEDTSKPTLIKKYTGVGTNNQAEYRALITALEYAAKFKGDKVNIYTDSLLVANQINGKWKVRHPNIAKLNDRAKKMLRDFKQITLRHVPREQNREADRLANIAIDEYLS